MFDLISLSKHATGAAVALVIADGAVGGEDPMRRRVPEPPAISAPARVRHLVHDTSGPRLVVPRGSAPRLDGRLDEEEWSAGVPIELDAGGHARFLHDGARLYVAIQGPAPGWSHVYLAQGDTVRVLHASAALGSVRYARAADGAWHTDEEFAYTLRDTSLSEAAVTGREEYFVEHGWVGTLFGMGEPGAQELAIDLARLGPDVRIAVLQAADPAAPTGWPPLADGTRDPVLARGDAATQVSFEPDTWAALELEN